MMKNIQWDTKTKIKTAVILFLTFFAGIFFESVSRDWTSAKMLISQFAAAAAFSAFVLVTAKEKCYSLKSVQGIATVISVVLAFGIVVSRDFYNDDALRMLFFAPVLLICSQSVLLMPVAAAISIFAAIKYSGTAVMFMPAVVGAALIYLSSSVKESPVWKKILLAVSELAVIGAAIYAFCMRRYSLTVHSLITEIWDSVGLFVAVVLLIALAVVSVMKKRTVGEIFGYVVSAAFAVIPMFLYRAYALPASAAMLMLFPVICQNGLPAEEFGEKALKYVSSKFKK